MTGIAEVGASGPGHHHKAGDRRLHRALASAPYLLLVLALVFTIAAGGPPLETGRLPWIVALTSLTFAFRVWWQLKCSRQPQRIAAFVVNLVLTLLLISLSPLFGVYAFVGYLDAVAIFSGPGQLYALVAAGSLNALAQSGGPAGALRHPMVFAFLLAANGGLAVAMVHIDKHRQRTVDRLQRALAELAEANRVNAALQEQVVDQARAAGVLEERQRLSREIHDTVAQGLIALLRQIEAAFEATTLDAARANLQRADATARDSLAEARRAVNALASPRLDQTDLPQALRTLVTSWSEVSGCPAGFQCVGTPVPTRHDADLLRVGQEGLANVAKHADASRVEVTLTFAEDRVILAVRDDGAGFDPALPTVGHGVRGMRERVQAWGGVLSLETAEGGGCTLTAAIPR